MNLSDPIWWASLMEIIGVNIILSGDNAVVIALAARSLPPKQQRLAVALGSAAAIVMRVVLTIFAAKLLDLPYLRLAGAALLIWIGVQLFLDESDGEEEGVKVRDSLIAAIRTIMVADLVMSLDNVIGVAAAAKGNIPLLIIGLAVSIPLIIFGSTLILRLMERFPIIITLGAGLLGWVAGEMAWGDRGITDWTHEMPWALEYASAAVGALIVLIVGRFMAGRASGDTQREGKQGVGPA